MADVQAHFWAMAARDPEHPFQIEFYDDPDTGAEPVREWMLEDLTRYQRRALGVALYEVLQRRGVDVCAGEYGKALGQGLFEFRLRHDADEIVAMHTAHTPKGEADEGGCCCAFSATRSANGSSCSSVATTRPLTGTRRQAKEIEIARKRLREFRSRPSTRR